MVGLSIPWDISTGARVKAARVNEERSQKIFEYNQSLVEDNGTAPYRSSSRTAAAWNTTKLQLYKMPT